jgi:hypothetical protein
MRLVDGSLTVVDTRTNDTSPVSPGRNQMVLIAQVFVRWWLPHQRLAGPTVCLGKISKRMLISPSWCATMQVRSWCGTDSNID